MKQVPESDLMQSGVKQRSRNSCSNFAITVLDVSSLIGIQNGKLENRSTTIRNFLLSQVNTSVDNFSNGLVDIVATNGSFA